MVPLRASPGFPVAGDGRHSVEQRRRAAITDDEHAPPTLTRHHLGCLTRATQWLVS